MHAVGQSVSVLIGWTISIDDIKYELGDMRVSKCLW